MSAHVQQLSVLYTLLFLGVLAAAPARAADPVPAKNILGKAQSNAERESLESLLSKLEAERRPSRPRQIDEAAKAEELARQLQQESASSTPKTSSRSELIAIPPVAETVPSTPGTSNVTPNSFRFPKALGGQPIGRPAAEPPPIVITAPAVPPSPPVAAAPLAPVLPPVAPGIHLSPGALPASLSPEPPPVLSEPTVPRARVPQLPPLLPPAARDTALPAVEAPPLRSAASGKKAPPSLSARRGLCTEILQRATLGELTEEDRAILRTQCR